jgi:ADP-ribosylglycohydrolase
MINTQLHKDIIIAGALGDAFGYFVEFDPITWIEEKYPTFTVERLAKQHSKWKASDDTQMTLFCLDAIAEYLPSRTNQEFINDKIYQGYSDWLLTQESSIKNHDAAKDYDGLLGFQSMWALEAPGTTCLDSLRNRPMGTIEKHVNGSKGCGGIMRAAPIAFIPYYCQEEIFNLAASQAAQTHGHPNGYLSAGYFAALLWSQMKGFNYFQTKDSLDSILKTYEGHESLLAYINNLDTWLADTSVTLKKRNLNACLGEGWVGDEALCIAIYCAYRYDTLEEVMEWSANHNGDSDSTASLAAQLFTARVGGLTDEQRSMFDKLSIKDAMQYVFDKI